LGLFKVPPLPGVGDGLSQVVRSLISWLFWVNPNHRPSILYAAIYISGIVDMPAQQIGMQCCLNILHPHGRLVIQGVLNFTKPVSQTLLVTDACNEIKTLLRGRTFRLFVNNRASDFRSRKRQFESVANMQAIGFSTDEIKLMSMICWQTPRKLPRAAFDNAVNNS
jgi:hypothetical protein